jgi:hypothetical protein
VATLTVPNQTVKVILRLNGTVIADKELIVEAAKATTVEATVANSAVPAGAVFEAELRQGNATLLTGQTTL